MVQISTQDGIECDCCGAQHRRSFLYYSLDFQCIQMRDNCPGLTVGGPSWDFCPLCWNDLANRVTSSWKGVSTGQRCDLTGVALLGTYQYHHGQVSQVTVHPGSVQVDRNYVELVLSPAGMAELTGRLRQRLGAPERWSTSST